MSFTLIDDPQFYGLEVTLSNILMNSFFLFKQQDSVFSNSYHISDHTIMTFTFKGGGRLKMGSVTCLQIFFVLEQEIYC